MSDNTAGSGSMNDGIRQLNQSLIAQHRALSKKLGKTTDMASAQAILLEMQEVNFRVMISGSLLFKQTTASIDTRIQGVIEAGDELEKSLKQLKQINDIIQATSKFLGLVDKVLDAIKLV